MVSKKKQITSLIIIRHAERIDDHRIPGGFASNCPENNDLDWRLDTDPGRQRPWDPPLSLGGLEQSEAFGRLLPHLIEEFKLPPLGAVYASPVVRCVETGLAAMQAHDTELLKMKDQRDREEASRSEPGNNAQSSAAANGNLDGIPPIQSKGSSMSLGSKFKIGGKKKKNGKIAAAGPDMATAVGMAHDRAVGIAAPSIAGIAADFYSATMDMLGLEDGGEEKEGADNATSADNGKVVASSAPAPAPRQKDRQI